ncbi:MAG: acetyltransferase, family [Dehalococcoidia bacterium]|nr:acetyltransferase, family [Dehalococcoidia bacterium]
MTTEAIPAGKTVLRLKRPEDAPEDYAWRIDEELSALDATTPLKQPYALFLRSYEESLQYPSPWSQRFAIDTLDGKHIGNCMCYDINLDYGEAEVGIMIGDRAYWNNGYGYHSMVGLVDYMFTSTSLRRLYLHTLEWNLRAQRSFEKCGFTAVRTTQRYGYKFIRMELSRDRWSQIRGEKLAELRREQGGMATTLLPLPEDITGSA